jgi:hypothetical protein
MSRILRMSPRSDERELTASHDDAFAAARRAAVALKWDARSDGADGGLDVAVDGSASLLRPRLTLRVRLIDRGDERTAVRATVAAPRLLPLRVRQADEILERFLATLDGEVPQPLVAGVGLPARLLVRTVTGALLLLSAIVALAVAVPTKTGSSGRKTAALPSVALGQSSLYRVEVGLAVFYGGLIVLTPVFYGLVKGRPPIEVSARGAKFSEDVAQNVDRSIKDAQALADQLKNDVRSAQFQLARARLNIDQLAAATGTKLED